MHKINSNIFTRRHILKTIAASSGASLIPGSMLSAPMSGPDYEDGLLRCSPLDTNTDPQTILEFIDRVFALGLDLHSFMLYKNNCVIAEGWAWPYKQELPHITHSLTKSVTATGIGMAIDEGYFSVEDKVVEFFNEELSGSNENKLKHMTIKDLLTMQSGHAKAVSGSVFRQIESSWITEFFKIPVVHNPGEHFLYSSAVSFMLSAILTKTTGQKLQDFLEPRFFKPLGITNYSWSESPNGINPGGNGLSWKTVDSLKLGILYLNKGKWNGNQLLSEEWVNESTKTHVRKAEYGYHWWQNNAINAYYAEGAFGQFSIVFPDHNAVLAITAGVQSDVLTSNDNGGEPLLDLIWKKFPKAFNGTNSSSNALSALEHRLENLRLLPEANYTSSKTAERITNKIYKIKQNNENVKTIQLIFSNASVNFLISDHRGNHEVRTGLGRWIESETSITGNKLHHQYQSNNMKVVAHAEWWDENTLEMTWQFIETAWVDRVILRFFDNTITMDRNVNTNYGSRFLPTIRGSYDEEVIRNRSSTIIL